MMEIQELSAQTDLSTRLNVNYCRLGVVTLLLQLQNHQSEIVPLSNRNVSLKKKIGLCFLSLK